MVTKLVIVIFIISFLIFTPLAFRYFTYYYSDYEIIRENIIYPLSDLFSLQKVGDIVELSDGKNNFTLPFRYKPSFKTFSDGQKNYLVIKGIGGGSNDASTYWVYLLDQELKTLESDSDFLDIYQSCKDPYFDFEKLEAILYEPITKCWFLRETTERVIKFTNYSLLNGISK